VKAFAYVNAANETEAIAALGAQRGRSLPIAGGLDLLGLMKDYVAQPERIVNVKRLDGAITSTPDGGLRVGAAARLVELVEHAEAGRRYPALVQAAAEVGTPQIRHVGTVGGNLTQRPRCWYFRNEEFNCLKRKRSLNERDARSRRAGVAARAPCCTNDELSRAAKQLNDLNNRLSQFVIEIGQLESTLAGVIIQRGRSTQRRSKHNA